MQCTSDVLLFLSFVPLMTDPIDPTTAQSIFAFPDHWHAAILYPIMLLPRTAVLIYKRKLTFAEFIIKVTAITPKLVCIFLITEKLVNLVQQGACISMLVVCVRMLLYVELRWVYKCTSVALSHTFILLGRFFTICRSCPGFSKGSWYCGCSLFIAVLKELVECGTSNKVVVKEGVMQRSIRFPLTKSTDPGYQEPLNVNEHC